MLGTWPHLQPSFLQSPLLMDTGRQISKNSTWGPHASAARLHPLCLTGDNFFLSSLYEIMNPCQRLPWTDKLHIKPSDEHLFFNYSYAFTRHTTHRLHLTRFLQHSRHKGCGLMKWHVTIQNIWHRSLSWAWVHSKWIYSNKTGPKISLMPPNQLDFAQKTF